MKKIKELIQLNTISSLTVNEMKNTFAGNEPLEKPDDDVNGTQYCKWTCISGTSSGKTGNSPYAYTTSIATSICGVGNFSVVC
ncbi:hypothetical protein SAMN05444484_102658 [Flavobacterium chilense]|uniref:Uncharacterized protein n=2 Tax=Flavobacterium chilense TaxID=946677 RepID=A0A1M7DP10_9FLAO|nr:hypothetical protein SAMN05444484_102658 [Flavobacterium chilense]